MCLRDFPNCFLNSLRLGAISTLLGGLSQCPATCWVKKLFLKCNITWCGGAQPWDTPISGVSPRNSSSRCNQRAKTSPGVPQGQLAASPPSPGHPGWPGHPRNLVLHFPSCPHGSSGGEQGTPWIIIQFRFPLLAHDFQQPVLMP